MTIKTVELPGGPALPYVEQGDPSGVPVLLLHGVTDSWRAWEPVLPYLPDSVRAVALTQRGHGDSEKIAGPGYRIPDMAADAADAIEELQLGKAIVVGHSMGAWVAQALAIDYPELVRGVVLAGGFRAAAANPVLGPFCEEVATMPGFDRDFAREFQLSTIHGEIPPAMDMWVDESTKLPDWLWRELFNGFLDVDLTPDLPTIEAPALLIWGERDAFLDRAEQERLVADIPDARLTVYEDTGHAVHWEHPRRFADDVLAFADAYGRSRTMSSSETSGRSNRALTA